MATMFLLGAEVGGVTPRWRPDVAIPPLDLGDIQAAELDKLAKDTEVPKAPTPPTDEREASPEPPPKLKAKVKRMLAKKRSKSAHASRFAAAMAVAKKPVRVRSKSLKAATVKPKRKKRPAPQPQPTPAHSSAKAKAAKAAKTAKAAKAAKLAKLSKPEAKQSKVPPALSARVDEDEAQREEGSATASAASSSGKGTEGKRKSKPRTMKTKRRSKTSIIKSRAGGEPSTANAKLYPGKKRKPRPATASLHGRAASVPRKPPVPRFEGVKRKPRPSRRVSAGKKLPPRVQGKASATTPTIPAGVKLPVAPVAPVAPAAPVHAAPQTTQNKHKAAGAAKHTQPAPAVRPKEPMAPKEALELSVTVVDQDDIDDLPEASLLEPPDSERDQQRKSSKPQAQPTPQQMMPLSPVGSSVTVDYQTVRLLSSPSTPALSPHGPSAKYLANRRASLKDDADPSVPTPGPKVFGRNLLALLGVTPKSDTPTDPAPAAPAVSTASAGKGTMSDVLSSKSSISLARAQALLVAAKGAGATQSSHTSKPHGDNHSHSKDTHPERNSARIASRSAALLELAQQSPVTKYGHSRSQHPVKGTDQGGTGDRAAAIASRSAALLQKVQKQTHSDQTTPPSKNDTSGANRTGARASVLRVAKGKTSGSQPSVTAQPGKRRSTAGKIQRKARANPADAHTAHATGVSAAGDTDATEDPEETENQGQTESRGAALLRLASKRSAEAKAKPRSSSGVKPKPAWNSSSR